MKLHLYFARRFLTTFLGVLGVFIIISALLVMVEQIREFDMGEIGFLEIVRLTFLHLPQGIYQILPLVMILSSIALFLALARSSEMVVTRAAGRSALRALMAPLGVALLLGAVAVMVFNPLVAATSKQYDMLSSRYSNGPGSTLSVSAEGLWLRQGGADGQAVIQALRANLDGTHLYDVTLQSFDTEGNPQRMITAREAELTTGAWVLTDAKEWPLTAANPERAAIRHDTLRFGSELTRDQILDSFGTPSAIPIWELPAFIRGLEAAGFSARSHRVWLQMELALPLLLASMVLVGAGFTMRHARFGRTGIMVVMALLTGFTLYFIRNFAQILGETGQIPVMLAAWGPPAAAVLLPFGILLHLEDG